MFLFKNQTNFYKGKVRNVYTINNNLVVMQASDRISAFDIILPATIPYKGQVLNQIAAYFLSATKSIVPNWLLTCPAPNISIGRLAQTYPVEMVIRGCLSGHAWRTYKSGVREICGVPMPDGLKENDFFSEPIITPTTKAHQGHDEDISKEDIISKGLVAEEEYALLENYTKALFKKGQEMAAQQGLILVDTKYEFGKVNNEIILIDEIHTPDSSRYFYADTYKELQLLNKPQRQLSKEFVREWLIANNFQGKEGQDVPNLTPEFISEISQRYIELYNKITGQIFVPQSIDEEALQNLVQESLDAL